MAFKLGLIIDQTDNGQKILLTDSSNWTDTSNTGATSVNITITDFNGSTFTLVDETYVAPKPWNQLVWEIPVYPTISGYAEYEAIIDGQYTFVYTVTGSPENGALTKDVLFDYNAKLFKYQKYNSLPYSFYNGNPSWNKQVQEACVTDVLVTGMQYSAEVGQTTKMNFILNTINDLKNQ